MSSLTVGNRTVETSSEDKVLFPGVALTKGDLIDYYHRIGEHLLVHVRDRPLVMHRFPDGIDAGGFYQRKIGKHFPDWISRTEVDVETDGSRQTVPICDDRASLVYLANQAAIALHPWLSRRDRLRHPDLVVIDLDPSSDDFEPVRAAALRVRDLFAQLEITSFAKLTGSRGVHVIVALDRSADFDAARGFARAAMALLAGRYPDELTVEQRIARRGDRLYLDTGRNAYAQTAVAPWSVRALPGAPIAAPIAWRELERNRVRPRDYTIDNVFARIARRDDPWHGWRRHAISIEAARGRLEALDR